MSDECQNRRGAVDGRRTLEADGEAIGPRRARRPEQPRQRRKRLSARAGWIEESGAIEMIALLQAISYTGSRGSRPPSRLRRFGETAFGVKRVPKLVV